MPEQPDTSHTGTSLAPTPATVAQRISERTFTQAEVNRIVEQRLARAGARDNAPIEDEEPEDSAQTEPTATGANAHSQRIIELEAQIREGELNLLRLETATRYGLSPEDRDTLLTGTDAETLTRQAERLIELGRTARARKQPQPVGDTSTREARMYTRQLFNGGS